MSSNKVLIDSQSALRYLQICNKMWAYTYVLCAIFKTKSVPVQYGIISTTAAIPAGGPGFTPVSLCWPFHYRRCPDYVLILYEM